MHGSPRELKSLLKHAFALLDTAAGDMGNRKLELHLKFRPGINDSNFEFTPSVVVRATRRKDGQGLEILLVEGGGKAAPTSWSNFKHLLWTLDSVAEVKLGDTLLYRRGRARPQRSTNV